MHAGNASSRIVGVMKCVVLQARQVLEMEFSNLLTVGTERRPDEANSIKS